MMKCEIIHRDSNIADKCDYNSFLFCFRDKSTNEFYARRNKALINLSTYIINNELTDKQREVVNLHIFEKLNNKQIALLL